MNDEKMSEDNIQIDTSLSKFEEVEKEQMERAEEDWISKVRELYKKYERNIKVKPRFRIKEPHQVATQPKQEK